LLLNSINVPLLCQLILKKVEDPRLNRKKVRVPRRDDYEKRPVLSATIHPDLKRTLVAMSERTGMTVSPVTDEVLYKGLVGMQEIDEL
jgi:hypothetical protein